MRFERRGELAPPDACHCSRRISHHVRAWTGIPETDLAIEGAGHLKWYAPPERVRRGSCSTCGAAPSGKPLARATIEVAMGTLDGWTSTRLAMHICVADKADDYAIEDGVPRRR